MVMPDPAMKDVVLLRSSLFSYNLSRTGVDLGHTFFLLSSRWDHLEYDLQFLVRGRRNTEEMGTALA